MRWKNGKGETIEIAVEPPGAALDAFDWRVSMAAVVEDGAFSCFEGIDRTLAVLTGGPLALHVGDQPPAVLTAGGAPLSFAADDPCQAQLQGPSVTDLNVMTRRGRWTHALQRLDGPTPLTASAVTFLLAAPDAATVTVNGEAVRLGALDALQLTGFATVERREGTVWQITLEPIGASALR
jgi:environmental stress-induced protein Ves